MKSNARVVVLLLLLILAGNHGCKKKTEEAPDVVTQQAEKTKKKKAKKSKKKHKKHSRAKARKKKKSEKEKTATIAKKASKEEVAQKETEHTTPESSKGKSEEVKQTEQNKQKRKVALEETEIRKQLQKAEQKARGQTKRTQTGTRTEAKPKSDIDVTDYVSVADLTRILPKPGWVSYGPIPGVPVTKNYNSILYRRPGTNRFVAVQIWKFDNIDKALEKWNKLLAQYPGAQAQKGLFAQHIFFATRSQVNSLVFVEPKSKSVIAVACHAETCTDRALYELSKLAFNRAEEKARKVSK